jgi:hypothetical protein
MDPIKRVNCCFGCYIFKGIQHSHRQEHFYEIFIDIQQEIYDLSRWKSDAVKEWEILNDMLLCLVYTAYRSLRFHTTCTFQPI